MVLRGHAGFPKKIQSECIAYNGVDIYKAVKITYSGSGNISFGIGTSNSNLGEIVWETILANSTKINLSNQNKALFWKAVGENGAILNKIYIKYYTT